MNPKTSKSPKVARRSFFNYVINIPHFIVFQLLQSIVKFVLYNKVVQLVPTSDKTILVFKYPEPPMWRTKRETGHMDPVPCNTNKMFLLYVYYVVYFSFRKRASASLVLWFFVPENNDTRRVTTPRNIRAPKAANSKSNEGRYHGNFPVFSFVNQTYSNRTESNSIHILSSMQFK